MLYFGRRSITFDIYSWGTFFHDILLDKYHNEEFVYAGTSAGAAAASNSMIYQGSSSEALLKVKNH
jgi:cyanophycinase-like exopeptidase